MRTPRKTTVLLFNECCGFFKVLSTKEYEVSISSDRHHCQVVITSNCSVRARKIPVFRNFFSDKYFFVCVCFMWGQLQSLISLSFRFKTEVGKSLFLLLFSDLAVCKPGYYSTNNGISPCVECPVGTYQNNDQQTQCFACPAGRNTVSSGSTSLEDCLCK